MIVAWHADLLRFGKWHCDGACGSKRQVAWIFPQWVNRNQAFEKLKVAFSRDSVVANPSALATFAWGLATSHDPQCSEQSDAIQVGPTSPKGPVV